MAKVTTTLEIDIPKAFFQYDLATEQLHCRGCDKLEEFKILTAEATRGGGPSTKKRFEEFMTHHAKCAIKSEAQTPDLFKNVTPPPVAP